MTEIVRTLRWSAWLGWQIEANWADLRLFALYLVVKPICGSMMLVCMYYAAQYAVPTRVPAELLPYMYVSNACYGLVSMMMFGMSYVVISDRESYRMMKYIYISPARFQAYFVGRGLARGVGAVVGAIITLSAGLLIPPLREALSWQSVQWLWLLAFLIVGAILLWSCGLILASAMLNMSRSGIFLSEGVAAVVYFLSGVIFPLSILPYWLQAIGMSLPTTYWLEGMRRSIIGMPESTALGSSPLIQWTNLELLLMLLLTSFGLALIAQLFYRYSVQLAWRQGRLEETTGV